MTHTFALDVDGTERQVEFQQVKSWKQAQFGYCFRCEEWFTPLYWSLSKTAGLHLGGTGHKLVGLRLAA